MNEIRLLSPLIGREVEQRTFLGLLDTVPIDGASVFVIWGQGGIGKTRLLEHFALLAEERQCKHSGIIDFYVTTNQRVFYLADSIVTALGRDEFVDFLQARDDYYKTKEFTTDEVVLGPKHKKMRAENYRALNRLSLNQCKILFFDTFEVVQGRDAGEFLLHELIPNLRNYLVVISGRRKIDETIPGVEILSLELKSFGVRNAYDYLNSFELKVSPKEAEEIWLLSGGRPILLSLTVDWLRETTDISNIASITPEDFEQALVSRIRSLATPEHETIMFMAHAFHRFDASLMAYLSGRDMVECEAILSHLSRLSFIKYKPSIKSCMLHDEMRDLVVNYVWDPLDVSRASRKNLSRKIITYYSAIIDTCEQYDQRMVYVTEQMYHQVYADPDQGIAHFLKVFQSTLAKSRLGYCDMLIKEVKSLSYQLNDTQKALVELCRSKLLHRSGDRIQARMIAEKILQSANVDAPVRAETQMWLREAERNEAKVDNNPATSLS
jgi:hypothetical protein